MQYVTLVGSEQVQRAANSIRDAADRIHLSVAMLQDVLERHQRFMDDWLERYRALLDAHQQTVK